MTSILHCENVFWAFRGRELRFGQEIQEKRCYVRVSCAIPFEFKVKTATWEMATASTNIFTSEVRLNNTDFKIIRGWFISWKVVFHSNCSILLIQEGMRLRDQWQKLSNVLIAADAICVNDIPRLTILMEKICLILLHLQLLCLKADDSFLHTRAAWNFP